jgi:hypothetical protein
MLNKILLIYFIFTMYPLYPLLAQKGSIKVQNTFSCTYILNKKSKKTKKIKKELLMSQKFNQKGQEIESIWYGDLSSNFIKTGDTSYHKYEIDYSKIAWSNTYEYDSLDRIDKEFTWYYKGNKKDYSPYFTKYEYDHNNKLTKEITQNDSTIEKIRHYYYNKLGNNTMIIDSLNDDYEERRIINRFDSLNHIIESKEFQNDKLQLRTVYIYSKDYRIETEIQYESEGESSIKSITETTFSTSKKIEEIFWKYINEGTETRVIYMYDKRGFLVKIMPQYQKDANGYSVLEYEFY